jgi:hypothetical protein
VEVRGILLGHSLTKLVRGFSRRYLGARHVQGEGTLGRIGDRGIGVSGCCAQSGDDLRRDPWRDTKLFASVEPLVGVRALKHSDESLNVIHCCTSD